MAMLQTLLDQIETEIGEKLSELDRRYDEPLFWLEPDYDAIDRLDAYISGLELLRDCEG